MLGVGERTNRSFDVRPATLIVERPLDRGRDEHAALAFTDPGVQSVHDLVVQAYVQTHGHMLAHTLSFD